MRITTSTEWFFRSSTRGIALNAFHSAGRHGARRISLTPGKIVIRILLRVDRAAFDNTDGFVQHPGVPRGLT
jgi:hypothetical protein